MANENNLNQIRREQSEQEKKASFSNSINFMIVLCFGIAFFIIYVSCVVVLMMNTVPDSAFYYRIIFMFLVFLLIYAISSLLVTMRIRKMFHPLDKLAHGLANDEIRMEGDSEDIRSFADSLKNDMRRMEDMARELDSAKMDLNEVQARASEDYSTLKDEFGKAEKLISEIDKTKEKLKADYRREKQIYDNMPVLIADMNTCSQNLNSSVEQLDISIKHGIRSIIDTKEDYANVQDAYQLLSGMLEENNELTENMFSELSSLQGTASQLNLFTTNLSLELARNGLLNRNVSAGLEELKNISVRISEKTDDIAMLIIRSRNTIKLAQDQSEFCLDQMKAGEESFAFSQEKIEGVSLDSDMLLRFLSSLSADLEKVSTDIMELQNVMLAKNREIASLEENQIRLKKIQKSMQNTIRENDYQNF